MKLPGSVGVGVGLGAIALAGVGLVAYLLYKNREKFNPTSDKNLAYQAANAVVQTLTGDANQTTGGFFHDLFNPSAGLAEGEYVENGVIRPKPSSSAAYNDCLQYQRGAGS